MAHRQFRNPMVARPYYINQVENELILSCNPTAFLHGVSIPSQFQHITENSYVLKINRHPTEKEIEDFQSAISGMVHAEAIGDQLTIFLSGTPRPGGPN